MNSYLFKIQRKPNRTSINFACQNSKKTGPYVMSTGRSDGSPYVKSIARLCVDYRRLNNRTEPDDFPMPRIGALLNRLGGATIMTKLDMTRIYWQVPIAPSDVGLTGFVTLHGHYHWRFMPIVFRNASATYSRLVTNVFKGLEEFCEAYLDDI